MKIDQIYLGTWFQRTNLHLEEIYRFIKTKEGPKGLERDRLEILQRNLLIDEVTFHEYPLNFIELKSGALTVTITEDGVILLHHPTNNLDKDVSSIVKFYEERFAPAIAYLFSLGAPLPKELEKAKHIYPLLFVVKEVSSKDLSKLFQKFRDSLITSVTSSKLSFYFGEAIQVIEIHNLKKRVTLEFIEELLRNTVFFREFETQLNAYLQIHRLIWDDVSAIRESKTLRYKDFSVIRGQVMNFLKTLLFVQARLGQMENILDERESLISENLKKELITLRLESFASLRASQHYIAQLWQMTLNYTQETLGLLETLYDENAQRELKVLNFMVFLGFITGFFGMNIAFPPWDMDWQALSWLAPIILLLITLGISLSYFIMKWILDHRRFKVYFREQPKQKNE